jgi:hypothetical protein
MLILLILAFFQTGLSLSVDISIKRQERLDGQILQANFIGRLDRRAERQKWGGTDTMGYGRDRCK